MIINGEKEGTEYDSRTFKSYKKYKQYRQKIEENIDNRPANAYIEQRFFNCLYCGKVNILEDILKERTENRTMRTKYLTWKKFKDISNELGGSLENGMNYLISLHERMMSQSRSGIIPDGRIEDDYQVPIAGFGGDKKEVEDKKKKK